MSARVHVAIAAITAFLLLPAASALASWTNPVAMSGPTVGALFPAVGVAGDGTAVVAYQEQAGRTFLAVRRPDGTATAGTPISSAPTGPPVVAANAAGTAAIAWTQSTGTNVRVHLRTRTPTGTVSPDTVVSQDRLDAGQPEIALDAAGDVFVSWGLTDSGGNDRTFLRVRSAAGTLGPVERISPEHGHFKQPHVAVTASGDAFLLWVVDGGADQRAVAGRARTAGGALGPVVTLSGAPAPMSLTTSLALSGAGTALVAWSRTIGSVLRVQARTRTAGGALTPIKTLSSDAATSADVQTAMSATGEVGQVAWLQFADPNARLQTRRLTGGAWSPVQNVSPSELSVVQADFGLSSDGSRAVYGFEGAPTGAPGEIHARQRASDGTLGPTDLVSLDNGSGARSPDVAVNDAGQAVTTWSQQRAAGGPAVVWLGANFL
jgi:hypothetical protein